MKRFIVWKYLVAVAVLAGGCAPVGPVYRRPDLATPLPQGYKGLDPSTADGNWKQSNPGDELPKGSWWTIFNDRQLNGLEDQIDVSNQNLKAATAQLEQARALMRANRAGFKPVVTGGGSISEIHQSDNKPIGHATYTDYVLPFTFSYEADVYGRVRHSIEQSRVTIQADAADLETIRLSIHSELALDYMQLRGIDTEKQLLDNTVTAYEKAVELTENRFKGGVASEADVAQARTQLETTRAQALDVTVQRAQLEQAVGTLVGKPATSFTIDPMPLDMEPPSVPAGVPSDLLERRPDIAAAERRIAAANEQIGLARTSFFPSLVLSAPFGLESGQVLSWLTGPSALWGVGPSALMTIFDGGKRRAIADQSRASYEQASATYQQTVLNAFQDVETNLAALRILADEAKIQDHAVRSAEQSLSLAMNRYKGGLTNYLQVITAQSIALANQRTAVQILSRRMTASVLLVKAVGGGWNASSLPAN
jgi:NodT family efflux transporter outer membrane factor (OMF) lipoprotein